MLNEVLISVADAFSGFSYVFRTIRTSVIKHLNVSRRQRAHDDVDLSAGDIVSEF